MRLLVLALLLTPVLAGEYTDVAGPHAVDAVPDLVLTDAKRRKELHVRVTCPRGGRDGEKHPVLVFSHGMYGTKDAYEPLTRFWASHGYVCLQTNHPDSMAFGVQTRAQAVRAWDARPRDVSFLIDSLPEIEKRVPALAGRLDRDRVAVGGHSFGAHTSQLIGGVTVLGRRSFRDDRVKCVLLLSPQGPGGLLRDDSWKGLAVPAMFVTGSNDESPLQKGKGASWRERAYTLSPAGHKYLVFIDGAHHGFGGITGRRPWQGSGPANPDHVRVVKAMSLAFLDAHVRGSEAAKTFLESDAPGEIGKIRYERK